MFLDLTNTKIGRLTPLSRTHIVLSSGRKMPAWKCQCDCGNEITAMTANLRKPGHTTSCGCFARENAGASQRTHGASLSRAYRVWRAMLDRCYNENDYHFKWYGARGISVCDRWRFGEDGKSAFECWRDDLGPKPTPKHTLDRINNDGNYEVSNCRWATMTEQVANQRPRTKHKPRQTHCLRGHKYEEVGIYLSASGHMKGCMECSRLRRQAA